MAIEQPNQALQTDRTKVRRIPRRGSYDVDTVYSILDKEFVCHIGFIHEGYPVVIPTLYGRAGNLLYVHGSMASRMMKNLSGGIDLSLTVTRVNGLVLARSSFHHSMNYESVVLFGKATEVTNREEKIQGLKAVSDHIIADRWEEVRPILDNEIKATMLLKIPIEEASAKIRAEGIKDDTPDYELDIWAGIIPLKRVWEDPIPDVNLRPGIPVSPSVGPFLQAKNS